MSISTIPNKYLSLNKCMCNGAVIRLQLVEEKIGHGDRNACRQVLKYFCYQER